MNYVTLKAELFETILDEVRRKSDLADRTAMAAIDLEETLKIAAMFGFIARPWIPLVGLLPVDFRDLKDCASLLPLFELLESRGWEATGSIDYPEVKNRDYTLIKNGITLRLGAYFTSHGCKKVPVSTRVEYRLECGAGDETTSAPTDDIPF